MPLSRCIPWHVPAGPTAARRRVALPPTVFALAIAIAGSGAVGAQVSPNGGEFQVNAYTTNGQETPAAVADGLGRFIVTFESYGSDGTDTTSGSIQVRRFAGDGTPLGTEIQVNSFIADEQRQPSVAADGAGRFVVVWDSVGSSGNDSSGKSVLGQRFDANGAPLDTEFQVNTRTTNYQDRPAVAMNASGTFVVVWQSVGSSGSDSSEGSIQAQRFAVNGAPLGGEVQVNTYTTSFQVAPAVAMDGLGRFVVVWGSTGSSGTDTSANSIQAQRFDGDGTPLGVQFQVNSYTTSYQFSPAVAADSAGNFVVVWGSAGSSGTDTSSSSIQAQRYDPTGAPVGSQFQVNATTTNNQHQPAVVLHASGEFVVAWQSESSSGPDADAYSVQLQRFRADGSPDGGESQVNSWTTGHQGSAGVAADGQGNFLVVWDSSGSSGTDADSASIQAQRYDALFRDGFESSDTTRWSASVP